MDSYIGNYHKFYRGTNYLDEMKEVLSDAAKWVVDSLVAHYGADAHVKGNTPAPLVPENVPGYELGLRVMELQVVKPPSYRKVLSVIRNTPQTAGAVCGVFRMTVRLRGERRRFPITISGKTSTGPMKSRRRMRSISVMTVDTSASTLSRTRNPSCERKFGTPMIGLATLLQSLPQRSFRVFQSRLPSPDTSRFFITGETHIIASIAEFERPGLPFEVHYRIEP